MASRSTSQLSTITPVGKEHERFDPELFNDIPTGLLETMKRVAAHHAERAQKAELMREFDQTQTKLKRRTHSTPQRTGSAPKRTSDMQQGGTVVRSALAGFTPATTPSGASSDTEVEPPTSFRSPSPLQKVPPPPNASAKIRTGPPSRGSHTIATTSRSTVRPLTRAEMILRYDQERSALRVDLNTAFDLVGRATKAKAESESKIISFFTEIIEPMCRSSLESAHETSIQELQVLFHDMRNVIQSSELAMKVSTERNIAEMQSALEEMQFTLDEKECERYKQCTNFEKKLEHVGEQLDALFVVSQKQEDEINKKNGEIILLRNEIDHLKDERAGCLLCHLIEHEEAQKQNAQSSIEKNCEADTKFSQFRSVVEGLNESQILRLLEALANEEKEKEGNGEERAPAALVLREDRGSQTAPLSTFKDQSTEPDVQIIETETAKHSLGIVAEDWKLRFLPVLSDLSHFLKEDEWCQSVQRKKRMVERSTWCTDPVAHQIVSSPHKGRRSQEVIASDSTAPTDAFINEYLNPSRELQVLKEELAVAVAANKRTRFELSRTVAALKQTTVEAISAKATATKLEQAVGCLSLENAKYRDIVCQLEGYLFPAGSSPPRLNSSSCGKPPQKGSAGQGEEATALQQLAAKEQDENESTAGESLISKSTSSKLRVNSPSPSRRLSSVGQGKEALLKLKPEALVEILLEERKAFFDLCKKTSDENAAKSLSRTLSPGKSPVGAKQSGTPGKGGTANVNGEDGDEDLTMLDFFILQKMYAHLLEVVVSSIDRFPKLVETLLLVRNAVAKDPPSTVAHELMRAAHKLPQQRHHNETLRKHQELVIGVSYYHSQNLAAVISELKDISQQFALLAAPRAERRRQQEHDHKIVTASTMFAGEPVPFPDAQTPAQKKKTVGKILIRQTQSPRASFLSPQSMSSPMSPSQDGVVH